MLQKARINYYIKASGEKIIEVYRTELDLARDHGHVNPRSDGRR